MFVLKAHGDLGYHPILGNPYIILYDLSIDVYSQGTLMKFMNQVSYMHIGGAGVSP